MSTPSSNILLQIKSKEILNSIFLNVPFCKLINVFRHNKKLQEVMKIDKNIYKYVSKAKTTGCIEIINKEMAEEINRQNPGNFLVKFSKMFFLLAEKHQVIENTDIDIVSKLFTSDSFIICGSQIFLINKKYKTGLDLQLPKATGNPIEFDSKTALIPCGDKIFSVDLEKIITNEIVNEAENVFYSLCKTSPQNFATCGNKKDEFSIKLWKYSSTKATLSVTVNIQGQLYSMIPLSTDNVIGGYYSATVYSIELRTGGKFVEYDEHEKGIFTFVKLSDNRMASGSADGSLKVWKEGNTKSLFTFKVFDKKMITSIVEIPNKKMIAVAGNYNTIPIYSIKYGKLIYTLQGHKNYIAEIILMNDGRLLSSSFDKCLRVWDLEQGQCDFLLKDVFSAPRFMVQISDETVYAVYFNGQWEVLSLRDVIERVKDMISFDKEHNIVYLDIKGLQLL